MSTIPPQDRDILRALGCELAKAAADPVNEQRREISRRINSLQKTKPCITIVEEPWNELNRDGELDLHCTDSFCRGIEQGMRQTLYKWRHHPGDMTVPADSVQPYCIHDTGFGITVQADIVRTDPASSVVSRHFHVQVKDEADIAKIKRPVVTHDEAETEECYRKRCEIFDSILEVRKVGCDTF